MSWDITLIDPDTASEFKIDQNPNHVGGTHEVGGPSYTYLYITWNYNRHIKDTLHLLHNENAGEMIPLLTSAVEQLGTKKNADYWKCTKGNAGFALSILLEWAEKFPHGRFQIH